MICKRKEAQTPTFNEVKNRANTWGGKMVSVPVIFVLCLGQTWVSKFLVIAQTLSAMKGGCIERMSPTHWQTRVHDTNKNKK